MRRGSARSSRKTNLFAPGFFAEGETSGAAMLASSLVLGRFPRYLIYDVTYHLLQTLHHMVQRFSLP